MKFPEGNTNPATGFVSFRFKSQPSMPNWATFRARNIAVTRRQIDVTAFGGFGTTAYFDGTNVLSISGLSPRFAQYMNACQISGGWADARFDVVLHDAFCIARDAIFIQMDATLDVFSIELLTADYTIYSRDDLRQQLCNDLFDDYTQTEPATAVAWSNSWSSGISAEEVAADMLAKSNVYVDPAVLKGEAYLKADVWEQIERPIQSAPVPEPRPEPEPQPRPTPERAPRDIDL